LNYIKKINQGGNNIMEFTIQGGNLPVLLCTLNQGESVFTQRGGMGWMTGNINMQTNMQGGLLGGIKRKLAGDSVFMNFYSCTQGVGTAAFPSIFPGSILAFELSPDQSLICEKKTFLCAEANVQLGIFYRANIGAGLFSGEGFIMQKVTGPGRVFLELPGHGVHHVLQPGEVLKADTGHVAAMTPTVQMNVTMVKGFSNLFFGGEGVFLTQLTGPGEVWLQSITMKGIAHSLIPYLPFRKEG
jgi:uncharacterized protein (TIGR00266 family)